MPTNLSTADASFPQLTEKQSTDEKIEKIQSYLYMLLESLRFQLTNLEKENFNDTAFEEISDIITEPVYAQISDVEGNVTSLALKADGLSLQIQNAEGDISTLVSRADILASQMTDAQGNISTLTQQSDALTTRVSNSEGNISSLQQTATSLSSRVSDNEGNISSLWQTSSTLSSRVTSAQNSATAAMNAVNGITLTASNGEKSSTLTIKSGSTTLDSAEIKFTGNVVFESDLTDGKTEISGDNIKTGTITGRAISGGTITGTTINTSTLNSPRINGKDISLISTTSSGSFSLYGYGASAPLFKIDHSEAYVNLYSPASAYITIGNPGTCHMRCYSNRIEFKGTIDFSNATVTGLS